MTSPTMMIGIIKDGIRKDLKPFATPEDSFENLVNAVQFRGRLVRRPGYTLLGTLANKTPVMGLRTQEEFDVGLQNLIAFDTTQAYLWNGTAFVNLPSTVPVVWSGTDYQFFFTTNYAGAFWATNNKPGLNGANISNIVPGAGFSTVTTTAPHGFTTGQTVFIINAGGVTNINGNGYVITVTGPSTFTIPVVATGVYTANGIALNSLVPVTGQDGIRYYGSLTAPTGTSWANYNPPVDTLNALAGALMIFPYRGYLVFLNTWEGNDQNVYNYGNRARWTQIGTPYYSPPVPQTPNPQGIDPNAARDDLFGKGGANDAPTSEVIVSAGFIRDVLIVNFERSTWRLRFVNNAQNPFVWERVNVELGSDCTFSAIPFDKGLMSIGNRGIIICDGNDAVRFDEKIPNEIFNIRQSNQGLQRVYGIRTFRTRLNYWTFPSSDNPDAIYPEKVLVYNYETLTWSFFDDSFTCFGYYYRNTPTKTWGDLPEAWASYTDITWGSGVSQTGYEDIVAGNQQGYVFVLNEIVDDGDSSVNDPSLYISAITAASPGVFTSPNNNLGDGTWITLTGVTGLTSTDGVSLNGRNFKIANPTNDANNFSLTEFKPIAPPINAVGTSYTYTVAYKNLVPGSIQINIGALVFTDPSVNGILVEAASLGSGTIDYSTGIITLTFNPSIASTPVNIRIVSYDPMQGITSVATTGVYVSGGQITKISNFEILTKLFNFFAEDKRARLSRIDFYMDSTDQGQFECNVFGDSSNEVINTPLSDNPLSNIVLTTTNPYQVGQGDETIYRLYCDAVAQTLQLQLTLNDQQMATNCINRSDVEVLSMIFNMRRGGRLV